MAGLPTAGTTYPHHGVCSPLFKTTAHDEGVYLHLAWGEGRGTPSLALRLRPWDSDTWDVGAGDEDAE